MTAGSRSMWTSRNTPPTPPPPSPAPSTPSPAPGRGAAAPPGTRNEKGEDRERRPHHLPPSRPAHRRPRPARRPRHRQRRPGSQRRRAGHPPDRRHDPREARRDRAAPRPRPEPQRPRRAPAHARRPRPGRHAPPAPLAGPRRPAHRSRAGLPAARRAARPLTSPRPACPPSPIRRNSIMDRPAIVIRDIHRYGDDLTVPEAIGRLCGGGQVTVTVTGPAPPGGDPRGNPRQGFDITVRPV